MKRWRTRLGRLVALGLVLCAGTTVLAAPSESEAPELVGPYLQNPSASGMTVCLASKGIRAVCVELQRPGAAPSLHTAAAMRIPKTEWTVWKAALKRLKPEAEYTYTVRYRQGRKRVSTESHTFRTLGAASETVKAAVFNDLHGRVGTLEALVERCEPDDFHFSVLLGDCWNDPKNADGAIRLLGRYVELLNGMERPMLFVRGNHECRGAFAGRMGYLFDLPHLDPAAAFGAQDYYFDLSVGPVRFLFCDCGEDFEKRAEVMQPYRKRQGDWMRKVTRSRAFRNARWRVKLSHIPLYNDNKWNSEPSRLQWEPVLREAGIDLSLAGHDHRHKVLPKGVTQAVDAQGERPGWEMTPPFPVMIGGGPSLREGTVMLLEADSESIEVRMLGASDGQVVQEIRLN